MQNGRGKKMEELTRFRLGKKYICIKNYENIIDPLPPVIVKKNDICEFIGHSIGYGQFKNSNNKTFYIEAKIAFKIFEKSK